MTVDRSGSVPTNGPDLVVKITEALERQGLPQETFVLNERINLDALAKLLRASSVDVHVYFDVQGVTVHVCKGEYRPPPMNQPKHPMGSGQLTDGAQLAITRRILPN